MRQFPRWAVFPEQGRSSTSDSGRVCAVGLVHHCSLGLHGDIIVLSIGSSSRYIVIKSRDYASRSSIRRRLDVVGARYDATRSGHDGYSRADDFLLNLPSQVEVQQTIL